ncbi:MAG: hypothetical protein GYA48_05010 [Chloroflexi bacterium]|nr:hypothetical protein [Chloroflexota bacterium]
MMRNHNTLKWMIGGLVCGLVMMACSLSGLAPTDTGGSEVDLQKTQLALQATQLAIQAGQLAAMQTAMAIPAAPVEPTALPTSAPAEVPAPDENKRVSNVNGVYFEYPEWLASDVAANIYDAPPPNADDPYFLVEVDHRIFEFQNYHLEDHFLTPLINIYPLEEFQQVNPGAAAQITLLKDLISWQGLGASRPDGLPFLPIFNAAQSFFTKVEFINTDSVNGLRYLTQYQQATYPIQNGQMIYTFQGITTDGKYYVSAVFPESHAILEPYDDFEYTAEFEENFMDYLREIGEQLRAEPDESFSPGLDALDGVIESLRVE